VRPALAAALAASLLLGAAPPAGLPDDPVSFITVDELKALLDQSIVVDVIDVRRGPEYDALHIKGARSIPLRAIAERIGEIPRNRLVVFY
jgi:rhodanese-related sulfurtransferase